MGLDDEPGPEVLLQPRARLLSHDSLVPEINDIYADLKLLEAKCIKKNAELITKPYKSIEQWQNLIHLHEDLL